jgi:hypothetical protein
MTMTDLEIVHAMNPRACERAKRLQEAIKWLREGLTPREVSGRLYARFKCSRATAWRVADMANDLAGKV